MIRENTMNESCSSNSQLRSKIYGKNIFDERESTNSLSELFSIVH